MTKKEIIYNAFKTGHFVEKNYKPLFMLYFVLGIILPIALMGCLKNSVKTNTVKVESIEGSEVFIPGRTVEIRIAWASDHEVTQAEYLSIMGYNPSECIDNPALGEIQENRPVECVSWYDAVIYCNKKSIKEGLTPCYTLLENTNPDSWGPVPTDENEKWDAIKCNFDNNGYRLPTEAEWEWLARGGNTSNLGQTTYSGSDEIYDVAWYCENCDKKSHEVKKKSPNAKGLYDMSGNVREWCWDWYGGITVLTPNEGNSHGAARITRGGDWGAIDWFCTITDRDIEFPNNRVFNLGFRLVRSIL